jgi:hypothetical protein
MLEWFFYLTHIWFWILKSYYPHQLFIVTCLVSKLGKDLLLCSSELPAFCLLCGNVKIKIMYRNILLAKAVPLLAKKTLVGRGDIAHSWASRPGRALPPGKGPSVPIVQEAGWASEPIRTQSTEEKSFRLFRVSNLHRPVVQPVAKHYTGWATWLTKYNFTCCFVEMLHLITHTNK